MWPFGKKKEQPEKKPQQDPQVQEFAQQFEPEEFTILAVTGFTGFAGAKTENSDLILAGIPLTAWMEEDGEQVHKEFAHLVTLADERLLSFLRSHVPGNFIIKAKVRKAKEGDKLQLIGMPEPGFDPDLKAILEEQKKPVTLETEDFGTFTLLHASGLFDAETQWNGESVRLDFASGEEKEAALATARALFAHQTDWEEKIRACAGQQALPQLNEQMEEEVSQEEFFAQFVPDSILVSADGSFSFWYGEGGAFWGYTISVSGTLADGVTGATVEGF